MSWADRLTELVEGTPGPEAEFRKANSEAIQRAAEGFGPDDPKPRESAGIRAVVNIPAAHVSAFCRHGYKNGYDLGKYSFRVGDDPTQPPKTRERVDAALPVQDPSNVYFAAAALSEAGVRFYGDLCLVLRGGSLPEATTVLDRNSYDLLRSPIEERIANGAKIKEEAVELAGSWSEVGTIAAIKVLSAMPPRTRRLTTGQIAGCVLDDEDYIEVLKEGSFTPNHLEAVRLASADSEAAGAVREKLRTGPPPSAAELNFLDQRNEAVYALGNAGIAVTIVVSAGRIR